MPNVPSKILNKVIEYATYHTEQDKKEGDKKDEDKDTTFDTEFVKVDQATLFELILVRLANPITLTSSLLPPPSSRPRKPRTHTNSILFLSQAANYLNIKSLLDLTCMTVANMIKGKTPEEIRKTFNIKNDFTPEEEEEVRRENQWAFE